MKWTQIKSNRSWLEQAEVVVGYSRGGVNQSARKRVTFVRRLSQYPGLVNALSSGVLTHKTFKNNPIKCCIKKEKLPGFFVRLYYRLYSLLRLYSYVATPKVFFGGLFRKVFNWFILMVICLALFF